MLDTFKRITIKLFNTLLNALGAGMLVMVMCWCVIVYRYGKDFTLFANWTNPMRRASLYLSVMVAGFEFIYTIVKKDKSGK